ncbi:hypothetical protein B0H13DRAFT_2577178 [Mycena leptocephala]|nr:hypothetical protein B0H13DRAFT_2577178 [Mycena leptocephala]
MRVKANFENLVGIESEAMAAKGGRAALWGGGMMMGRRAKLDLTGIPFEQVLSLRPEIMDGAAWNMLEIILSSSDPRHFVTSLRSKKVPRHLASILVKARHFGGRARTIPPFFVTTIHTELRCRRFAVARPPSPVMDYAWCFGRGDWAQTQSDPTVTGGFFDENINHLQWNSSTCNTPTPLVPDSTPFMFGLEMGFNGTPKNCRRKSSTTQAPSNTSTSASDVTVADETIPASTIGTSERTTSPSRKRSGSTALESDAPPKRLRLGPLKGWGIERDGVNMSAVEYPQKHWSEFRDEYPECCPPFYETLTINRYLIALLLSSDTYSRFRLNKEVRASHWALPEVAACQIDTDELRHCVSWIRRPEDRGRPWHGALSQL